MPKWKSKRPPEFEPIDLAYIEQFVEQRPEWGTVNELFAYDMGFVSAMCVTYDKNIANRIVSHGIYTWEKKKT